MARRVGDPETLAVCLDSVAQALAHSGEKAAGIPYQREAVELRKKLGTNRIALGHSLGWLALALGVDPTAEPLAREAIALHRQDYDIDQLLMIADLWNLGRVLMANSKFAEAEPVFRQTLEKCQEINSQDLGLQGQLVWHLAITLTRQDKWSEAETFTRKATETMPNNGYHWNSLGRILACRGDWQAAVDQFRSAVRIKLGDDFTFDLALALLMAGNQEEYQQVCHKYLQTATNEHVLQNPQFTDKAAVTLLLLPVAGDDFDRACQWAEFVEHTNDNPSQGLALGHLTKALAESRKANYQLAIDLAQAEVNTKKNTERQQLISSAQAYFIQAAAYARQGQFEQGKAAFAAGDEQFTRYRQELRLIGWWDLAVTNYLRREADELLAADSAATGHE
jgi:tetratricopeptide (TPR) repeat protein